MAAGSTAAIVENDVGAMPDCEGGTSADPTPGDDSTNSPEEGSCEEVLFIGDLHYESFPPPYRRSRGGAEPPPPTIPNPDVAVLDESTAKSDDHRGMRAKRTSKRGVSSPPSISDDGTKERTRRGVNSNDRSSSSTSTSTSGVTTGMELWIDGEWVAVNEGENDDTRGEGDEIDVVDDIDDDDDERARTSWIVKLARKVASRVCCSKRLR
jgi:hypothetical protein